MRWLSIQVHTRSCVHLRVVFHYMNRLLLLSCFLMMNSGSSAQTSKFDELWHKMFFNIFIHKPDSSAFDFIKKYFPAFTEKPEPGGWTVYPTGPFPELQYTDHSLTFKQHPYFENKVPDS